MNLYLNKTSFSIIMLSCTLCCVSKGFAQFDKDFTHDYFNLRPSVKTVNATIHTEYEDEETSIKKEELEFNESGKLLVWTRYNSDGNIYLQDRFKYDDQDNVLEYVELDNKTGNALEYKTTFKYDEASNLRSWLSYNPDGSIDTETTIKNNKAGSPIEMVQELHNDGIVLEQTFEYDEKGREIEHILYNDGEFRKRFTATFEDDLLKTDKEYRKDKVDIQVDYKYDKNSNKIEEKMIYYDPDESVSAERVTKITYENGQKSKSEMNYHEIKGDGTSQQLTEYDNKGNPLKIKSDFSDKTYAYDYDEQGNWTEQTEINVTDQGKTITTTERKIDYFKK